jgi:hypothetical protein
VIASYPRRRASPAQTRVNSNNKEVYQIALKVSMRTCGQATQNGGVAWLDLRRQPARWVGVCEHLSAVQHTGLGGAIATVGGDARVGGTGRSAREFCLQSGMVKRHPETFFGGVRFEYHLIGP